MKATKLHIKRKRRSPEHVFVVYVNTAKLTATDALQFLIRVRDTLKLIEQEYNIYHYIFTYNDPESKKELEIKQLDYEYNEEILKIIKSNLRAI